MVNVYFTINILNVNGKMVKSTLWYLVGLFTFMEVFVRTQITVRDTSHHDFIQNSNEVKYLVDDISTIHKEFSPGIKNGKIHDIRSNNFLRFEPEFLDFKERPLGVPHLEKVTLFNINNNKSIDMTSISGNTVHFHSSFFEDKKIPPNGNTTFNVVFLGREEGQIESNLFIHTSEGTYKFQVRGTSVASPYRLRPIIDIRVLLNSSFSPLIYMHNPHTEPIQIVEVYSSGGEFHLELPTGELEGPKGMWEIPPFQTKPIIRVRFNARTENNYTAYVRIKANGIKDVLVVPLEVEVSGQCGLHTPQGTLDFGVGGTLDKPKQLKLLVYNTLKKPIRIQSISTTSKAIHIDYQANIKVPSELKEPIEIATLHLDWKKAYDTKDFFGKIMIKHKQGKNDIEIPYWATVFQGGLFYNASVTKYLTDNGSGISSSRNFTVTNKYEYPLAITNISLPSQAQLYFSIKYFKSNILQPNESATLFELTLNAEAITSDLKLKTFLIIHTNISNVEVPLLSYNGKLTLILPGSTSDEDKTLDLGLVGSEHTKQSHFILLNNNPVDIKLMNIGRSIQSGSVELVGCASDDNIKTNIHFPPGNMTKCTQLRPGEYAVFRVTIQSSKQEGQVFLQTFVQTQFHNIIIPIRFRVAHGKLEIGPDRLVFDECFPGKICTHPVRIHSTFVDPMAIESISSIPPDPRLSSSHSGHITARSTKIIGHLFLDPVLGCHNQCYTGLPLNSSVGVQWLKSFSLPSATCDLDLNLLNMFYGRYLNITTSGRKWQNLTLRLDTTEVKGHFFHTRVKMSWPKLIVGTNTNSNTNSNLNTNLNSNTNSNKSVYVFTFPLTQIGNTSYKNITIRNPSNAILTLQLVMDWAYPQLENLLKNLPSSFINGYEEPFDSEAFFFHETHNNVRNSFIEEYDVYVHHKTVPLIIPARETVHVTIGFRANVTTVKSAFMYVRNNLTILEIVKLTGQGAHPSFKFGNRKPGSQLPLLFELTDKHLRDCEKEKNRKNPAPNLTVKRSFTARNTGDISVIVNAFYINRFPCEGYGFKVLNCEPFELIPNGTRKIDIAFTPDFSLSKIHRTLVLHTSLNVPVNYTLITTVPPYFLAPCGNVLPRPSWEPILYYACISLMLFLLFIVVSVCFIESDRILRSSLQIRHDIDTQPLDLRFIGTQTRTEIRSTHQNKTDLENEWNNTNNKTNKDVIETQSSIIGKNIWHGEQHTKETLNHVFKFEGTKITKKKLNKRNSNEQPQQQETQDTNVKTKTWGSVFSRSNSNNNNNNNTNNKLTTSSSSCSSSSSSSSSTTPTLTTTSTNINSTEGKKSPVSGQQKCDMKKVTTIKNELTTRKKINVPKKVKTPELPCSEEETSSTTTESSNNEEIEKFNEAQIKQDKQLKKPVPSKKNNHNHNQNQSKSPIVANNVNCDFRDNYEGDGEDEDFEKEMNVNVSSNRWKPTPRSSDSMKQTHECVKTTLTTATTTTMSLATTPTLTTTTTTSTLDYPARKNNQQKNRERKEKNSQKRRAAEKATNKNNSNSNNGAHALDTSQQQHATLNTNLITNIRVSPPVPPVGVWGESRATFSDVVARNDTTTSTSYYNNNNNSTISTTPTITTTQLQQQQQQQQQHQQQQRFLQVQQHPVKPTLYVEPTQKQKQELKQNIAHHQELGPIGSKKPDPIWSNETLKSNNYNMPSNSFFTEPQHQQQLPASIVVDAQNSFYDYNELWSGQENAMNNIFQQNTQTQQIQQEIPSLNSFHENWTQASFWEPLCAPVGDNRPQNVQHALPLQVQVPVPVPLPVPLPLPLQLPLQTQASNCSNASNSSSNDFLWNSTAPVVSSVWSAPRQSAWSPTVEQLIEPVVPVSAPPPVRSPPGFNREQNDRPQNFDPFTSFSNIWTPHNPDTWAYNPHNNNNGNNNMNN